jgi:hypothetical protein
MRTSVERWLMKQMEYKLIPSKGWFTINDVGQGQKKVACRRIDTVRAQVVARTVNQDFVDFGLKSRCRL